MIDRVLLRSVLILMLPAGLLAGCGSYPAPEPTATPDIAATVNAEVSQALGTPIAQPTGIRPGQCRRLCDEDFLRTAGVADVQDELDRGADIAARDDAGWTPLHWAAANNTEPAIIALLLDGGADIAARADDGWTPCQVAQNRNRETDIRRLLCR